MDKAIYKYPLSFRGEQTAFVPEGFDPLCVQMQGNAPCLWGFSVVGESPSRVLAIKVLSTGEALTISRRLTYLDTIQTIVGMDPAKSGSERTIITKRIYFNSMQDGVNHDCTDVSRMSTAAMIERVWNSMHPKDAAFRYVDELYFRHITKPNAIRNETVQNNLNGDLTNGQD